MLGRPSPLGLPGRRHRLWGPPFLTTPSFSQDLSSPAHQIRLWGILSLTAPRGPPPAPPRLLRDPGGEGRVAVARTESSFASYSPAKSASFLSRMGRGRGAACARGGGNSFPGELGAATRRSACPFFSSSPGLLLGAAGGRRGGGRMAARSAPQWGDRPPHARPAPRRAPGLLEWKSGDGARVPPPPPPRPWVGSRETCWRETRGDSHPPAALPRLP